MIRPLDTFTGSWLLLYYEALNDLLSGERDVDAVARTAIRHAYLMFRVDVIAVALLDGDDFEILPWRVGPPAAPLRIRRQTSPEGTTYEAGQIVEIADLGLYSLRFPEMRPLLERGMKSLVAAAFGLKQRGRGYLAFCSPGDLIFSDNERSTIALYTLTVGIAFDAVTVTRR